MAAGRGPSWRRPELIDLLDIWGETRVQNALKESHRNLDVFSEISKRMEERGHSRGPEECRSKTKAMRQSYKRVLAHNEKSGNSPTSCAFFQELHRILKGDPSVKKRPVKQSLNREVVPGSENVSQSSTQENPIADGIRALVAEETEISEDMTDARADTENGMPDNDATQIQFEIILENAEDGQVGDEAIRNQQTQVHHRDPDDLPPDAAVSELSPSSRSAYQEKQRRKMSSIAKVGEAMLRQSSREHRAMLEASHRDHGRLFSFLERSLEEDRRANQTVCDLFRDAVGAMSQLSKCYSERIRGMPDVNTPQEYSNSIPMYNPPQSHQYAGSSFGLPVFAPSQNPPIGKNGGIRATIGKQNPAINFPIIRHAGDEINLNFNNSSNERQDGVPSSALGTPAHDHPSSAARLENNAMTAGKGTYAFLARGDNTESMLGEDSSPDVVWTHVWGDTPCKNPILRENERPFTAVTGIDKQRGPETALGKTAMFSNEAQTHSDRNTANQFKACKNQGVIHQENQEGDYGPGRHGSSCVPDTEGANVISSLDQFQVSKRTSEAQASLIHTGNSDSEELMPDLYEDGSQSLLDEIIKPKKGGGHIGSGTQPLVGRGRIKESHDKKRKVIPESQGRSRRICKPKKIYSPDQ